MKSVRFQGTSREDLKAFPKDAEDEAGYQLFRVQSGRMPTDWKPMPSVGRGVSEIRIHDPSGEFRVIYVANREDTVFVLHCFTKKTQKTPAREIALARRRLADI